MSNALSYDPVLVRSLAAELDQRLRGRACAATPIFAAERSTLLPLDRGEALSLQLHPARGWVRILTDAAEGEELDAVCEGVEAPADERRLIIHLHADDRFRALRRRLVVELHGNQWNALLVSDGDDRILSALWARAAGDRVLRPGAAYHPPAGEPRFGAGAVTEAEARAEWEMRLIDLPPDRRRRELLRHFAWTGTANADAILGDRPLGAAFSRWWRLRSIPEPRPVVLERPDGLLPYPVALPGYRAEPVESLLAGMELAAEAAGAAVSAAVPPPGLRAVRRRLEAAERRAGRLEEELTRAGEAGAMRHWGDLLLARKRLVPHGAERVRLQGWDGKMVEVTLDPTLDAAENARHWYDEARKRERADARIPQMLESARAEVARWAEAMEQVERGEPPEWLDGALGAAAQESGDGEGPSRPYRLYRTSGGLEVRVGRSAKENDRLTFAHSGPGDVWLHARSVPGSHVILRWRDEGAPPARDLGEAAALAALFSKARSSALVPVDWTRRKYVRKPRGAAPGAVIPQRVRTLFVEPDQALEERLRAD